MVSTIACTSAVGAMVNAKASARLRSAIGIQRSEDLCVVTMGSERPAVLVQAGGGAIVGECFELRLVRADCLQLRRPMRGDLDDVIEPRQRRPDFISKQPGI